MFRYILPLIVAGLFTTTGCEPKSADKPPGKISPEDVRRDAGEAVDTAVEFFKQSKEEFQKKLDGRLTELDAEIAELREKGGDLKDQAKVDWDRKLADLETKREAARAKLTEVGQSTAEAWKDVKQGAQSAWDELEKAFQDALDEF